MINPLKIAFVIPMMGAGGAERVAATLCNIWAAQGHEIHLITFESSSMRSHYTLAPNIHLHRLDLLHRSRSFFSFAIQNLRRIAAIRSCLRAIKPNVAVSFMPEPNVLTTLASSGQSWPVVVSERVHPAYLPLARVAAWMRKRTYPHATAIVVQASSIAEYVERNFKTPATIIPNPVDLTQFFAMKPRPEAIMGQKRIVSVGRLEPQKGMDVLVAAFAALAPRFSGWSLQIYGEGTCREALQDQVTRLKLTDRVFLAGTVSQIASELQQADIYVQSSRFEGTPNAVIEALACGCPVVATDCPGGIRDIITSDLQGRLVPTDDPLALADALSWLMSDDKLRSTLRETGRDAVAHLSAPLIAKHWIDLFYLLIAAKKQSRRTAL